jgi:hypothetical protein
MPGMLYENAGIKCMKGDGMKIIAFCLLISIYCFFGCSQNSSGDNDYVDTRISEVKTNLGDFQYIGLDPKLSFVNSNIRFDEPEKEYGSPSVKYTTNVKQNNPDFPLDKYNITVIYAVHDQNAVELIVIQDHGIVENGILSLSNYQKLYGLDRNNLEGLTLKVKEYYWHPISKREPFIASE